MGAMSTKIRVPRTTVEMVVGLAKILREHLGLELGFGESEHWTFEQLVPDDMPGVRIPRRFSERYLAVGAAGGAYAPHVELRAQITWYDSSTFVWQAPAIMYHVFLWMRRPNGEIHKENYILHLGGRVEKGSSLVPDLPPDKIAFEREATEVSA